MDINPDMSAISTNVIPTPSHVPQPTPHDLLMEGIRQQNPADVSALQEQLHAVWKNMSYIALSVLLGKTSPLHVKIVGCSCVRLRDAVIDALPIRFAQPPPPSKPQPMLSVSAPADDEPGDDCCAILSSDRIDTPFRFRTGFASSSSFWGGCDYNHT